MRRNAWSSTAVKAKHPSDTGKAFLGKIRGPIRGRKASGDRGPNALKSSIRTILCIGDGLNLIGGGGASLRVEALRGAATAALGEAGWERTLYVVK